MAKKVISTLQKKEGKKYSKLIIPIKSKDGSYYKYNEKMVPNNAVQDILNSKK